LPNLLATIDMSSCEWFPMSQSEIRAWIRQHPEALPSTWADLGRFPMAFRRVLINEVGSDVRSRLWREHLESFLRPESGLTQPQRDMIVATAAELPHLLAAPAPNPTMLEWEQRAATVFSRQDAARIFMLIGPPEPPEGIPLPAGADPTRSE
jgi:hypothetical protein